MARFSPQVGQPFGDKSISPFSIKVEVFLRMAGIGYVNQPPSVSALKRNSKRKLPTIVTDRGEFIADSTFIINHLMATEPYASKCRERLCDGRLSPSQIASGTCLKALCEESLYFIIGYWRYASDPGFARYCEVNPTVSELGVGWLKRPLELFARRAIIRQLWAQGTGRHTPEQVEHLGNTCLDAVDVILGGGQQEFLFGGEPSSYDATLFAFLSAVLEIDLDSPLQTYARSKPGLVDYVRRINRRYGWPA